jgi:hypothetical protein
MSLAIAHRTTGELITASIWNTDLADTLNGLDPSTSTITTTGTQTALAIPTGFGDLVIFANNASLLTIQGIAAGVDGQRLTIYAIGAGQVDLAHQNGSASAANRLINFATSGNTSLAAAAGSAEFEYDATAARWRLTAHEQGAWIYPAFSAGNFTGNGAMTWTVASGDVNNLGYYLRGRLLTVNFLLATTSVGGTPSTNLLIGNGAWGGFTINKVALALIRVVDSGGAAAAGLVQTAAGGTTIPLYKDLTATGNWSAATDTTSTNGQITFEVQ